MNSFHHQKAARKKKKSLNALCGSRKPTINRAHCLALIVLTIRRTTTFQRCMFHLNRWTLRHTFHYRPLLHTRPQRLIIIHQQPIAQSWVRCEIQAEEDLKHKASFVMHQLDGWCGVNNQSSMRKKKLSDLPFYVFL